MGNKMISKITIDEYSKKRYELTKYLKKFFLTLDEIVLDNISSHLINEHNFDLNSEKDIIKLNNYINNWDFRNVQNSKNNFYAPIEKTIINLIFYDKNFVSIHDSHLFPYETRNALKIFSMFENEPTIFNLINHNANKINSLTFKITYELFEEIWEALLINYNENKFYEPFKYKFQDFYATHKYIVRFLCKYEFEYKNNFFVDKENFKIKINKNDLSKVIVSFIDLLKEFLNLFILKINELLTYEIINKFETILS